MNIDINSCAIGQSQSTGDSTFVFKWRCYLPVVKVRVALKWQLDNVSYTEEN